MLGRRCSTQASRAAAEGLHKGVSLTVSRCDNITPTCSSTVYVANTDPNCVFIVDSWIHVACPRPISSKAAAPAAAAGTQLTAATAASTAAAACQLPNRRAVVMAAAPSGSSPGIDLAALGLEIPDIDASDIQTYQQELGAEFDVSIWS